MKDIATLVFTDELGDTDPKLLSEFLALFEGCVNASHDLGASWDSSQPFPFRAQADLLKVTPLGWNEYFDRSSGDLFSIHSISKNSPIEIALAGSLLLLSIAVVFSGGTIEANTSGFKAQLPSLGEGIRSLKKALGLDGKVTAKFSIRTITIKLSKDEKEALLLQDPSKRGKGGFQDFLIGLQSKLNRTTRELTLSDVDLERIMRYKANPKKGGFQGRFERIFGRHFPNE